MNRQNQPTELRWSSHQHNISVSGRQDVSALNRLKNVILSLRKDWGAQSSSIKVEGKEDYQKRLHIAEKQIEGILKRKINYTAKDAQGGQRVLDYTNLLNEKENQIVELEKKIQNLEQKLRKSSARENQLENQVVIITEQLKRKEDIISLKHQSALAEVANSTALRDALNTIRKNIDNNRFKIGQAERLILNGVTFPEVGNFDIKADSFSENNLASRSRVLQQMPESIKNKTKLVQFFREFQRLNNQQQGFSNFEVERIIEGFINNMPETKLYANARRSLDIFGLSFEYQRLRENFSIAATIFADLVEKLKRDNKHYSLPKEVDNIFELLQREKVVAFQGAVGNIFIDMDSKSKVVEVPVQDARTKHLIHLLAREFKRIYFKYPKIQGQIDEHLAEFLQQEIIDVIEVDEIDKLIQIVKIKPELVKVENVYRHCNEKERRKEFHLRVLIKALLEELQKVKLQTGVTLQLDEGVIGMIKSEIMDTIDVDDILKVFRINQKIVEVEKIVEKIVERVVQIPKVVTVDKIVQKIVQVEKIKEVQKIVHVPIEKPMIVQTQKERLVPYQKKVQTIVEVPTIVQKIVELQKQVSKVMEVELVKQKIVEVDRPFEVQRVVNHIQVEIQQVEVQTERIVPVQKIVQKIVEVPVFVETIVEKIVEVPKVIEVEKIVEKIVPVVEYRNAKETENHIETKYQIVDRIVEKVVPVIQIKERIKQVPKEVQVIKQVTNVVTQIKQVEVIREKLVVQQVIKQVEKIVTQIVEVIKEVPQIIQKFIEVPIIREIPVIKEIVVEKAVISRVESVHIKQVVVNVPFIVKEPVVVEVEKFVNVYVDVPKTIKYIEEKIVEVPTIMDRIKEVPVQVEKIIEKMVQVPRVVQVQKIVQKVVVVPRVIEKVIEVPQFIQKIIEKQVIREKIVQVEKTVQVPVIKEVIKETQVIKNIYIEIQKPVDKIIEKSVEVPTFEQRVVTKQIVREVPITIIQERPVQMEVEKVVPMVQQCIKTIPIDRQVIVPFEIPVPVETIIQKIVPKEQIIERVIPQPQIREKIVPVVQYVTEIKQVQKYVQKILIERQIKEVEKIVPYIQEVIKEIPTIIEKIVTIEKNIDNIVTVEKVIEKVIEKTVTLPQIYQVQRIKQKLVEVPKLIEIEKIVPQMIRVNQYIHKISEKLVEVPTLIETIRQVVRDQEKVVPVKEETTEIVQVQKTVEKLVYAQKLKQVVRNVNYIEKVLQIVDRIEQIPVAVATTEEKFIEVPYIIQKIVEKIVVMPQIVEVLKYIHEVCESEDAGVAVDVQVGVHEARYKELSKNIERHLDDVLKELRYLKTDQKSRGRIQTIEKFLDQLRRFILTPRIVKVVEEKLVENKVEVDRVVKYPTQDEESLRMELSLSVLVEKLITELKRIKQKTGVSLELDEDISLIFFNELNSSVPLQGDLLQKLQSYSSHVNRQFQSLGSWTTDQEVMLRSFLQERFLMAQMVQNVDFQLAEIKTFNENQANELSKHKIELRAMTQFLGRISKIIRQERPVSEIVSVIEEFNRYDSSIIREPTIVAGELIVDNRVMSMLREKDAQISSLRDTIFSLQKTKNSMSSQEQDMTLKVLKSEIDNLRSENTLLQSRTSQSGLDNVQKSQIMELQSKNFDLETEISRLRSENYNLSSEIQASGFFQHAGSFRRDPQSSIQEVEARESGFDKSRYSQSSQGRSLTGEGHAQHTESVLIKPGEAGYGSTGKKLDISQQDSSRYTMSGTKPFQSSQERPQQTSEVIQGANYIQNQGVLYASQKRSETTEQNVRYPNQPYQSGTTYSSRKQQTTEFRQGSQSSGIKQDYSQYRTGQLGQGKQLSQSGIRQQFGSTSQARSKTTGQQGYATFGVEDSHSLRMGQGYSTGQQDSRIGSTTYGQGVQQASSLTRTPARSQTGYATYGQEKQIEQEGSRSGIYGSNLGGSTLQNLFASRQEGPMTLPRPQTQSQGNISRVSGASGLQGSQFGQGFTSQPSVARTPIEGYKFTSPSPSGAKMTSSIIRQEQNLSRISAESPQPGKIQVSRSQYQYYTRSDARGPEKKQEQKK